MVMTVHLILMVTVMMPLKCACFFNEDENDGQGKKTPPGSGCCVALLFFCSALSIMAWGITNFIV